MFFASQFIVCEIEEGCDKEHSDIHFNIPRIIRAREIENREEVVNEIILARLCDRFEHRAEVKAVKSLLRSRNLMYRFEDHAGKGRENKDDYGFAYTLVVTLLQLLFAHKIARQNHEKRDTDAEKRAHSDRKEHQRPVQ